jgi:DNA invertase Pin-like site-specific DNA recombinase
MDPKRVGLYLRVSTGEQTVENQRAVLREACERRGWTVVEEFVDAGISGAKGRDKRPGLDKLLKAVTRRKIDVVAAWSVDRLGRSLQDLLGFLGELNGAGVDLYLDRQAVDTTTPAGRALFQMLGVFAEFERSIIQERVQAGVARARAAGVRFGRPEVEASRIDHVRTLLEGGCGILRAAKTAGVGTSVAQRIANEVRAP